MRVNRWMAALAATLTAVTLASCGEGGAGGSEDVITFGAVIPLSGAQASYGDMARGGLDMAVAEINADGGIDGRQIEMKYEDNQGVPASSATAAQKLTGEGIEIIFTHGSSVTAAITQVTERKDVLLANMAAQSDVVVSHPQVHSFLPTNGMELGHLAELAYDKRGARKLAVIHSDDDYGHSAAKATTDAFEALGGTVVAVESHPVGAVDMRAGLIKISGASPDAVAVLSNTGEIGHIVKQARELKVDADIMGADSALAPSEIEIGGDAYEGMIGVAIRFDKDTNEAAGEFAAAFEEEYGMAPNNYAAISYESMKAVAAAIEAAGEASPEVVGEQLLEIDGEEGVLGSMTFNSDRVMEFPIFEWEFVGGEITALS